LPNDLPVRALGIVHLVVLSELDLLAMPCFGKTLNDTLLSRVVLNINILVSIARSMIVIIDVEIVSLVSSKLSVEENFSSICDLISLGTSWWINSSMRLVGGGGSS
jgi:hypothetical protein